MYKMLVQKNFLFQFFNPSQMFEQNKTINKKDLWLNQNKMLKKYL